MKAKIRKKRITSMLAVMLVISLLVGNITASAAPVEIVSGNPEETPAFGVETVSEPEETETEEHVTTSEKEDLADPSDETSEGSFGMEEDLTDSSEELPEDTKETEEGQTDPEEETPETEDSEPDLTEEETEAESVEEQIEQYNASENPSEWLSYNLYLHGEGWQAEDAKDGVTGGRENSGVNAEALWIDLDQEQYPSSGIRYRVHMQTYGWLDWVESGTDCGRIGSDKRMEAVQMTLTGKLASEYDIYYRVYVQDYGWLGWAKNGAEAGSSGLSKRLEAIQIRLIVKTGAAPGSTSDPFVTKTESAKNYPNTHINTGDKLEDVIAIAQTQVGYRIDSAGRTKYGSWYGNYINGDEPLYASAAWCAMFVSWCADQAGVSAEGFRYHSFTETMRSWYISKGRWSDKAGYTPKRGDLIFFKYTSSESRTVDHVGIVTEVSGGYVMTIEGNNNDSVREGRYALSSERIVGYAIPDYAGSSSPSGKLIGYTSYVEGKQWGTMQYDGAESGTVGSSLRLQALKVQLQNQPVSGGVSYRAQMQTYGWTDWAADGAVCGVTSELKRMEAVQIKLTGDMAQKYDIYYRIHSQTYGWLDWAKNGESAGTEGFSKRVEAIQIVLVAKGGKAPGSTQTPFRINLKPVYQTHVQTYGWQDWVSDGEMSGTTGQSKRLEGIRIRLENHTAATGGIEYCTHVQTYGWQDWVANGEMSGTSGQSKRLEAIRIRLTGSLASRFDVYYRVHAQTYGWLGWAKNGEEAGTEGLSRRLEGIEIVLVPKGAAVPGSTADRFIKKGGR